MIKVVLSFGIVIASLTSTAMARPSFDEWKQRADVARDSGEVQQRVEQIRRDRETREHLAAIPNINRQRLANLRRWAAFQGGYTQKPRVSYDADGELDTIEVEGKSFTCRIVENSGVCINTTTLEQAKCLFGAEWQFVCL